MVRCRGQICPVCQEAKVTHFSQVLAEIVFWIGFRKFVRICVLFRPDLVLFDMLKQWARIHLSVACRETLFYYTLLICARGNSLQSLLHKCSSEIVTGRVLLLCCAKSTHRQLNVWYSWRLVSLVVFIRAFRIRNLEMSTLHACQQASGSVHPMCSSHLICLHSRCIWGLRLYLYRPIRRRDLRKMWKRTMEGSDARTLMWGHECPMVSTTQTGTQQGDGFRLQSQKTSDPGSQL